MSLLWRSLKTAFLGLVSFEARQFEKSLQHPEQTQTAVLKKILADFNIPFRSIEQFQKDFSLAGEEQLATLPTRLRHHRIIATETTSGSSGKPKPIPYTPKLMGSFHHMFRLWAWDVLRTYKLSKGTFFFSISPQVKQTDLQEDSDYLQGLLKSFMKRFWIIDAKKMRGQDPKNFMKNLSFELLKHPDLEIISIWSPSYLLSVLNEIKKHQVAWSLDPSLPLKIRQHLQEQNIDWKAIWPDLHFISVWGSGMAEQGFSELKKLFPGTQIQAKGLLATEAPMTIPWSPSAGFLPLLQDVFFEFIDDDKNIHLLHELKIGKTYEIVISTFGGLFRYRLGDQVQVRHYYKNTPCLDFLGRSGDVCDLAGEKISEWAVRDILKTLNKDLGFYLLVPDQKSSRYLLFSEKELMTPTTGLDFAFKKIFHYDVARSQGQLDAIEYKHRPFLRDEYFQWLGKNIRLGDIKEKALIANLAQAKSFLDFVAADLPPSLPSVQSVEL